MELKERGISLAPRFPDYSITLGGKLVSYRSSKLGKFVKPDEQGLVALVDPFDREFQFDLDKLINDVLGVSDGHSKDRPDRSKQYKLNKKEASSIFRTYWSSDSTQADLAEEYGVSMGTISGICRGASWKAIHPVQGVKYDSIPSYRFRPSDCQGDRKETRKKKMCFTPKQAKEIFRAYWLKGKTQAKIARDSEVSRMTISRLCRMSTYSEIHPIEGIDYERIKENLA